MKRHHTTKLFLLCTLLAGGPVFSSGGALAAPSATQAMPVQTIRPGFVAHDTAALPGGQTVVFGTRGLDYVFARFTAGGQPDPSFGSGGEVRLPGAGQFSGTPTSGALRLIAQADGRLLALGDHVLLRLLPDGRPDAAFGQNGRVTAGLPGDPQAIAALPDGRVLVAGGTRALSPNPAAPTAAFAVSRLLPSGQPDPSFGAGGQVVTPVQASAAAYALLPLAGGGALVAGTALSFDSGTYSRWTVARYTSSGSLDAGFGQGGLAGVREDRFAATRPSSLAVDARGRILTAGVLSSGLCDLVRVLPGGARDPEWSYELSSDLRAGGPEDAGANVSLALLPGGDAALGGCAQAELSAAGQETAQPVVARVEPGGLPSRSFGERGLLGVPDSARLKITPQGRLLVGLNPVSEFTP